MKERERERERESEDHSPNLCITFVPFFPSRIFQISNSLLTKRSTKTDSRERVLSREGSLNFSHKEREKRERERALERGLLSSRTEREV